MHSVWSQALWTAASKDLHPSVLDRIGIMEVPRIGCDVAWKGDDKTEMHVVWDVFSVHHERHAKIDPVETSNILIELAREWAERVNARRRAYGRGVQPITEFEVLMQIDDDGLGGAVVAILLHLGYNAVGIGASNRAIDQRHYPNKRSELWFMTVGLARKGLVNFGLLPAKIREELGRQLKSPEYQRRAGMREVEPKEKTKDRLGRSPDSADAMNLAYYERESSVPESLPNVKRTIEERVADDRKRGRDSPTRRMFGR